MPHDNIPSRLSRANFERFRAVITSAADLGRTIEVSTGELAPATVAARLRDALLSYRRFHWGDTEPRQAWSSLSVYTDKLGRVFIGTVQPTDEADPNTDTIRVVSRNNGAACWPEADLRAMCHLITAKRIEGGIKVPPIPEALSQVLESDFDIAINTEPDASIIF
jgi:hypothetical protein